MDIDLTKYTTDELTEIINKASTLKREREIQSL